MTGPAVLESTAPAVVPAGLKPQIVLSGASMLPGFEEAAKAHRRKAAWYFNKDGGYAKVVLRHRNEDPVELTGSDAGNKERVTAFLMENLMPLFGPLDGETFDKYIEAGKGMVWSLFPAEGDGSIATVEASNRPMMTKVAKQFKGKFSVTYTDLSQKQNNEAILNMFFMEKFPAIAVQKKAGDKKKYVYDGEMVAWKISAFLSDVDSGVAQPRLRTEGVPSSNESPVKTIVGSTFKEDVFTPNKDVFLEVYAPWCGHCKKMQPEFESLATQIKTDGLDDLLTIAWIDGTANDSPVESMDWSGFPTLYFVKAGQDKPILFEGERTEKGIWRYIKRHATQAAEIKSRLDKKSNSNRGAEL